eukprot:6742110-Pyramimonas_sp.AAC.1
MIVYGDIPEGPQSLARAWRVLPPHSSTVFAAVLTLGSPGSTRPHRERYEADERHAPHVHARGEMSPVGMSPGTGGGTRTPPRHPSETPLGTLSTPFAPPSSPLRHPSETPPGNSRTPSETLRGGTRTAPNSPWHCCNAPPPPPPPLSPPLSPPPLASLSASLCPPPAPPPPSRAHYTPPARSRPSSV